jgi:hypothetical protein
MSLWGDYVLVDSGIEALHESLKNRSYVEY